MNFRSASVLAASCVLVAACGGGGGDDGAIAPGDNVGTGGDVPSSAVSSVSGLVAYVKQLIASSSESAEPVVLRNVTLPVDDTAEPAAL
ncbi:hypothetical protein WG922_21085 [Ramlibacter sp. AN1015]|uniref:hypothetical protein n=1 Tax=Ramlibacter sp. AN1015 TaxID=3133428 RepID=UPI0030BB489E